MSRIFLSGCGKGTNSQGKSAYSPENPLISGFSAESEKNPIFLGMNIRLCLINRLKKRIEYGR
jgi:hypothetical protein